MRTLALEAGRDAVYRPSARIGPNAIIQLGIAAGHRLGLEARREIFDTAGLGRYLITPPDGMVDETDVVALHRALQAATSPDAYRLISWEAGLLTGDYILANRIPKPAQTVLKLLPRKLAAKALSAAIGKHAWTFAGSGVFRIVSTWPIVLEIGDSPLSRDAHSADPMCDYYAGTFTRLFRSLVDPGLTIVETHCAAVDGGPCRFENVSGLRAERTKPGHPGA